MQLRLEPVTQENRLAVLGLRAGTGQEGFVETVSACLDEAAQRADWRPMAIYDGTAVVGFAMYGYFWEYPPAGRVWLDRLLIDAANLRSAVRCARMGKGSDFLSQVLLPGGNVEAHVLTSGKGNDLAAVFRAGPLSDAAAAGAALTAPGSGELTAFERLCDDAVMGYLAQARRIPFGEQAVVGYLYAREAEFTAIRTILSGRMAGLDADTIRERLREAYV